MKHVRKQTEKLKFKKFFLALFASVLCHFLALFFVSNALVKKREIIGNRSKYLSLSLTLAQDFSGEKSKPQSETLPKKLVKNSNQIKPKKPQKVAKKILPAKVSANQKSKSESNKNQATKPGEESGGLGSSRNSPGKILRDSPVLVNADQIKVSYPKRAKLLSVEGIVKLRLTVAQNGQVVGVKVLSGPAFGLRQAALKLAKKLFFLPATDNFGQAKIAQIDHEVVFRLVDQT